jgi:hypothetical protein
MKRYRTKAYIVVYESYEACNEGRGGRCGGLQAWRVIHCSQFC